ncbi:MAG: peptidoglycan-binding domain-containing protein [Candidatus Moraniibacteriota bacterium]
MNKNKNKIGFLLGALFFTGGIFPLGVSAEVSGITIDPALDISRFAPYTVKADISEEPISASLEISGINGDDPMGAWDYYADGTVDSQSKTKTMTYDEGEAKWETQIYPDDIYPEIFFAPSEITWNNTPSLISIRRNNYHILHFENPFNMAENMNFFVEINAEPVSLVNSADLSVYLVEKNKDINFFRSDWRNSSDVELIGTIGKEATFHHNHVIGKSSHHLVPLTTNPDGTVGTKSIDIGGDFWIILYANSPNVNRGWNLKYHNSSICDNSSRWYAADQSGWRAAAQSGCPDAHIHVARRGANSDGAKAIVTASYADSTFDSFATQFYFEPLPNLPPVPTNFISPVAGGNYGENINIAWNAASDPNGDPLTYTINLLDSNGNEVGSALVSDTGSTSFWWDIGSVNNGEYGLRGEVCDDSGACADFYLDANFTIFKAAPIYSLSTINISSDNETDSSLAETGDEVTLLFTSTNENISNLEVLFYSGGYAVFGPITISNEGNSWKASFVVIEEDEEGSISFVIRADNLDFPYLDSTDGSYVSILEEEEDEEEDEVLIKDDSGIIIPDLESNDLTGEETRKAKIISWKAFEYEKPELKCVQRLRLEIKGKYFEKDAEVRIGNQKAFAVDRKSSKKIVAKFCIEKLLENQNNRKRNISVKNPDTKREVAEKKINLDNSGYRFENYNLNSNTPEGVKAIQRALNELGYLEKENIIGIYGPKTRQAVRNFQIDNSISPTGEIGPTTKEKLAEKL